EKASDEKEDKKEEKPPKPVEIDVADFERRAVILPPKPGRFADLAALPDKLLYRELPRTGDREEKANLVYYDLDKREENTVLDDAVTRWDVNYVLGELIAELNASHTYRSGGDLETGRQTGVGYLGVNFSLENGAYRIKKIIEAAPWDAEVRSPLSQPGVDVKQGD